MTSRWLLAGALLLAGCHKLLDLERVSLDAGGSSSDGGVSGDAKGDAPTSQVKLVFLTSMFKTGALGGIAGADAHCQELATAANLPGDYMAWLSTSTESPSSRMTRATIPYALVGGAVIADNWDDLVDGQLKSPILLTETGEGPVETTIICQSGEVWSNTNADGTWTGVNACTNWTTTSGTAETGRYTTSGPYWTESDCTVGCNFAVPYYCFQQ